MGPERLENSRATANRVIELENASHRDPSGVIPAMADAVRERDFNHAAVKRALSTGALRVVPDVDEVALPGTLAREIESARAAGARSVGVFGHSNLGVAELAAGLAAQRVEHVLVGISEAQAEGLNAIAMLCRVGLRVAT